eukprot:TRINITY_DN77563_c0_g1_i1.p1 TRINITY_DN77563_c0_g1~~TRINITY_DN77563_c0_g1_i1.p1  ORF type:complete len:172 (-),score=40.89 TRINITY_DN77563_c0_g1_i1:73-588(-)
MAALLEPIRLNDVEGVQALLKDLERQGFKKDELVTTREFGDRGQRSALHLAAIRGRAEIIELLLSTKADANAVDEANTSALSFAADMGHARAAYFLLKAGADPNSQNAFGSTPTDKLVVNSWDEPPTQEGKSQISRLIAGEKLPYESLRPEPLPPAKQPCSSSPSHRRGGA